jgi:hypothetical protein
MSTCICRGFSHDPNCPMTPRPETDAPAATPLRDHLIEAGQTVMNGGRPDRNNRWRSEVATVVDALLPLLRAHDAQVAAQARQEQEPVGANGLTATETTVLRHIKDSPEFRELLAAAYQRGRRDALDAVLDRADEGIEFGPSNYLLLRLIVAHVRRDRAVQDTPDQANT